MSNPKESSTLNPAYQLFEVLKSKHYFFSMTSFFDRIKGREAEMLAWVQLHPNASREELIKESYNLAGLEDVGNTLQGITRWIPAVEHAFQSDSPVPHNEKHMLVSDVLHSVWEYTERIPEYENLFREFFVVLSQNGMSVRYGGSLQRADLSTLDVSCILSMFICIGSNCRFDPNNADHFFYDGYALKWLKRLEELSENSN